jgi:trehalose-phosphatase
MPAASATDIKYVPRALERVAKIRDILGARPAIFLDFDGTLAPIVDHPSRSRMPQSTRTALRNLVERVPVAVISGRSAIDVRDLVGVPGIIYSGSHGQEISFPDNTRFEYPESVEHLGSLDKAERLLAEKLIEEPGVWVERKPFAIAVHTRQAELEKSREVAKDAAYAVAESENLRIHGGKEIWELRPPVDWHKGKAIKYLLGFIENGVPLFIGDDETDEDGFVEVRKSRGVSVVVEKSDDRLTSADYRLHTTHDTTTFLTKLREAL